MTKCTNYNGMPKKNPTPKKEREKSKSCPPKKDNGNHEGIKKCRECHCHHKKEECHCKEVKEHRECHCHYKKEECHCREVKEHRECHCHHKKEECHCKEVKEHRECHCHHKKEECHYKEVKEHRECHCHHKKEECHCKEVKEHRECHCHYKKEECHCREVKEHRECHCHHKKEECHCREVKEHRDCHCHHKKEEFHFKEKICKKLCGLILLHDSTNNFEIWKNVSQSEVDMTVSVFNSNMSAGSMTVLLHQQDRNTIEFIVPPGNTFTILADNVESIVVIRKGPERIEGKFCIDLCFFKCVVKKDEKLL
jgi:hypothetical protein